MENIQAGIKTKMQNDFLLVLAALGIQSKSSCCYGSPFLAKTVYSNLCSFVSMKNLNHSSNVRQTIGPKGGYCQVPDLSIFNGKFGCRNSSGILTSKSLVTMWLTSKVVLSFRIFLYLKIC